ncbi:MAG: prenyltransferase [Syntrophorhabdus sp.]|nr:prenyltransferase [Syntrophorhabdus sp.]
MTGDTLKAWAQASRLPFFVATFIPLIIGWSMAVKTTGAVRPGRFLLVLLGSLIVHLITNLANDYFDHLVGTDAGESIGGSRVIQEGKISPRVMLKVIIGLYAIAFFIAYIIVFHFRLHLLAIPILFSAFSSYFYVAPPIRYGYHGLGELFVGINMGPIMVAGTYWVVAGTPALEPLLVSIPVGIMVASILYYQSLPDMRTDEASGKMTLAVRLGRKGAFRGLIIFFILIYASILSLILMGLLSPWALASIISVLLVVKLMRIVLRTDNWVLLDLHGKYVRMVYFISGLSIIAGIVLRD